MLININYSSKKTFCWYFQLFSEYCECNFSFSYMLEAHNGYRTSHATVKIAGSISHLCNGLCMVIYEEIYRKATAKKNTVFFFFFSRETG